MPIDFARIARDFAPWFKSQLRLIPLVIERLSKWIGQRTSAAAGLERASRAFPVIAWRDGAITLRLASSQQGALVPVTPAPTFGQHLARGGASFIDGFARIADMIDQEETLPRFLTRLDAAVALIEASIARWARPLETDRFAPTGHTASDLFGQAALGFRLLSEASQPGAAIDRLLAQLTAARTVWSSRGQGDGSVDVITGAGPRVDAADASTTLGETLDYWASTLLGAAVVLVSLPLLVTTLVQGALLRVKLLVLSELEGIERAVFDLRGLVFDALTTSMPGFVSTVFDLVGGVRDVLVANVRLYLTFAREYLVALVGEVRTFLTDVVRFVGELMTFIRDVMTWITPITTYDLRNLIASGGAKGAVVNFLIPAVSADLLLDRNGNVNYPKGDELREFVDDALELVPRPARWILKRVERRRINAIYWLIDELFPAGGTTSFPDSDPVSFDSRFPDVGATLFGSGRAASIESALVGSRDALTAGVDGMLGGVETRLGELAVVFDDAAQSAARMGSVGRYRRLRTRADSLADGVFGVEVRAERERRVSDPLASAYERWLADGGIALVAEAVPLHAREMARYFHARINEGSELTAPVVPTSPRILRKHAILGRVRVPRVRLRVTSPAALDAALAQKTADAFQTAVQRAYREASRRLDDMRPVD